MTADEYRLTLKSLGLSQVAAARLLGVDARTSRRWALGEVSIPRAVELLLRRMARDGVRSDELPEAP